MGVRRMLNGANTGDPMTLRDVLVGVSLFLLVLCLLAGGVAIGLLLIHWITETF